MSLPLPETQPAPNQQYSGRGCGIKTGGYPCYTGVRCFEEVQTVRKLLIVGAVLGCLGAGAFAVRRFLFPSDPMSEIDASGQDGFDAPEQRWSPAESRPRETPEDLQQQAKLEQAREDILQEWPQISAADFDAAGDDLNRLAEVIASHVPEANEQITVRLRELMASAAGKASFPVT